MSTTWQSLCNSGQACGANWQHAIVLHPTQDRGGQQDCRQHPQPAGQRQKCYWLLLCRACHPLCQCRWPFPGQAFLVTCTLQSLLLRIAGCTKMCSGQGLSCGRLYAAVQRRQCLAVWVSLWSMVPVSHLLAMLGILQIMSDQSCTLPVSSSRTPLSLSCVLMVLQTWCAGGRGCSSGYIRAAGSAAARDPHHCRGCFGASCHAW